MEHCITDMMEYMAKSHEELERILKAGRDMTTHLTSLVETIPDRDAAFAGVNADAASSHIKELTSDVMLYLNSIGDLQEVAAENLKLVMHELTDSSTEE